MTLQSGLRMTRSALTSAAAQPGTPLTSADVLSLAQQTQAVAFNDSMNRYTKSWVHPGEAPAIDNATVDTWVAFQSTGAVTNVDIQMPWTMHPQADVLNVQLQVAVDRTTLKLSARVSTETMVTSVASTTSPLVFLESPSGTAPGSSLWSFGERPWVLMLAYFTLKPTLPADRRIAITVDGRWWSRTGANPGETSIKRQAKLYSMRIFDSIDSPDPEA